MAGRRRRKVLQRGRVEPAGDEVHAQRCALVALDDFLGAEFAHRGVVVGHQHQALVGVLEQVQPRARGIHGNRMARACRQPRNCAGMLPVGRRPWSSPGAGAVHCAGWTACPLPTPAPTRRRWGRRWAGDGRGGGGGKLQARPWGGAAMATAGAGTTSPTRPRGAPGRGQQIAQRQLGQLGLGGRAPGARPAEGPAGAALRGELRDLQQTPLGIAVTQGGSGLRWFCV